MQKESKEFLYKLLRTPSPTGFEQKIQRVVKARMERYSDTIESDLHGNLIVALNPKAKKRIMLAGHCDQIGLMVTNISSEGYLYVGALGGMDVGVLAGSNVTIHSSEGAIDGVIGRKAIHQQSAEERTKVSDIKKLWVDIGASSRKEVEKLVKIGDPITFKLGITELGNGLVSSPGMDDKVGLFVAMEALRLCAKAKMKVGLFAVSTVQEEVGLRGARTAAFGVDPEVGIAIDVTHASDHPGLNGNNSVPCKLGSGPVIWRGPNVNSVVEGLLVKAAKRKKIAHQLAPANQLFGNDANAIQISRAGVAAASIGIPNRYMHTAVEVCSLKDLELAARLLAEFIMSISERTDFRPR